MFVMRNARCSYRTLKNRLSFLDVARNENAETDTVSSFFTGLHASGATMFIRTMRAVVVETYPGDCVCANSRGAKLVFLDVGMGCMEVCLNVLVCMSVFASIRLQRRDHDSDMLIFLVILIFRPTQQINAAA